MVDATYSYGYWGYTLWLFNIAMENGPFIDDFPIKTTIYRAFSMAMLNNQMVNQLITRGPHIVGIFFHVH